MNRPAPAAVATAAFAIQRENALAERAPVPRIVPRDGTVGCAPDDAPVVAVRDLTKRFGSRRGLIASLGGRGRPVAVVDRASFDVARGEVFGILGPNGAGKTTLFRMLATMIRPDAGTALVGGADVVRQPAAARAALAMVPADERSLHWRLSALENLRLFAALHRLPRGERLTRANDVLQLVGLGDVGAKLVGAFSSGMRQRLLIARALIARPRVLLLDEPTRALDPVTAVDLRRFLRAELIERHGCTIVVATHNADEAFDFCDRVAVLHRGRILATGPAVDLARRVGEERYRLLLSAGWESACATLERSGVLQRVRRVQGGDASWQVVECTIPGEPSRSARALELLVRGGVQVARWERCPGSLADLITRIIHADAGDASDA